MNSTAQSKEAMTLIDQNPGPILVVDLAGKAKYSNIAFADFLRKGNLKEWEYALVLPPDYVNIFLNCKAAEVGIPVTRMEYRDNAILWTAYFSEDKQEIIYQGVDITHLHRNEIALTAAKERAEEGEKLKTAFLDNMSHEIRTPLNSLLGFMNLLSDELMESLSDDQKFYFELIHQNGDRLARTMQEILDISHFSSGTYDLKLQSVDVSQTIMTQIEERRSDIEAKGLGLTINLPEHAFVTSTDEYCVRQAVAHLIDNAIKYTESGHIYVGVKPIEGSIEILVEDTGPGMSDDMQRLIFVAFNQGTLGHSRRYQGIGLGLSLVRLYMDSIHATVDLDSSIGGGSRFKIRIPN
ncbi:MAG: HAMP domain-containing histidine kinase [Candidatus Marinimicrobia bacterium]|nr:HAMP domain-containing histidine kinase [Candidatus Neomarinimicrobiota bacterium]